MCSGDSPLIDGSKVAGIRVVKGMLIIEARSGYRMQFSDPNSYHCFLDSPEPLSVLGESVLLALNSSRQLTIEEAKEHRSSEIEWNDWVLVMLSATKIKTSQKLFQKMASCCIREKDGNIVFAPSIKKRGAAWEGRGDEFKVSISNTSDCKLIGQAAIEALSLCIPKLVV
jgi:hypothetical protein